MTVGTQDAPRSTRKLQTIGAVCRRLKAEFPDISISKIRYLEDQGLLRPSRTPGGYRLFGEEDVERLETILRLQRDQFLPLRVIRQELASAPPRARRRRSVGLAGGEGEIELEELCARAGITPDVVRDLEEYGLIAPQGRRGSRRYVEADAEIAAVCARLGAFGISARHLRTVLTAADRAASLLAQVTAPALRSRNPERRQAGLQELQVLGELAQELSQLLLWRDLRRHAAG